MHNIKSTEKTHKRLKNGKKNWKSKHTK
uniref:Uncharacterized protein n=1 Tax=Rhizophora mucronata TaxID=61149 RepID=A0A2P2QX65_RHIMU